MTDALELLPCPFCGGEAEVRERMDENIWDHSTVKWVSIGCSEIDCEIHGFDWPEDAEPNAADLWNTRANQQALEAAEARGYARAVEEATEIAQRHEENDGFDQDGSPYVSEEAHLFGESVAYGIKQDIRALAKKEGE